MYNDYEFFLHGKQFIERYYETYPEIKSYLNQLVRDCEQNGYVKTIMNRVRYVPEIHDKNYNIREFGKRVAMNSPIQGSAADIIKIAMVRVYERLKNENLRAKLIMQVHDELIVECPEAEKDTVCDIIRTEMENACEMKVQLLADVNSGANWYLAKG